MDEVLIANFMIFQDAVEEGGYDLVIADEAWDIDHYWHEHPELKKAKLAWFTDFVGYVPMPSGGEHEAFLTTDYNAEMIEHIERHPGRARPRDLRRHARGHRAAVLRQGPAGDARLGAQALRFRRLRHRRASPRLRQPRGRCASSLGYRPDERVCIVTVGGSGVGAHLIRRILQSYPMVQAKLPELRMIVVAGPRIDPRSLDAPAGVEVRAFVPNLDRHLAACDLALVQGGLTTCMELTAAGTPFLYFPLQEPFRAELPCRPPPRPLRRRHAHGVRDLDAGHDRRCGSACPFQAEQSKARRSRRTEQSGRHDCGAALMPDGKPAHGWAS